MSTKSPKKNTQNQKGAWQQRASKQTKEQSKNQPKSASYTIDDKKSEPHTQYAPPKTVDQIHFGSFAVSDLANNGAVTFSNTHPFKSTEVAVPQVTTTSAQVEGKIAQNDIQSLPEKKPSSWASLFSSPKQPPTSDVNAKSSQPKATQNSQPSSVLPHEDNDLNLALLQSALGDFKIESSWGVKKYLELRGLANPKNKCFLNVILQVLMSSRPFFALLSTIAASELPESFTVFRKFTKLYNEYQLIESDKITAHYYPIGMPFTPDYFYPLLNVFNPSYSTAHTYQEDAQEFLLFMLDKMHEELTVVRRNPSQKKVEKPTDQDDWLEVGKGNKSSVLLTKEDTFKESLITDIFGGTIRSSVKKLQATASVSLQPFFSIALDIKPPDVNTLEQAIAFTFAAETIEGYTDSRKHEIVASKHTTIEKLPQILIFHLKRFSFIEGAKKITKFIEYPSTLTLRPSFLSRTTLSPSQRKYRLFAVISHVGTRATNGHYVCDVKHAGHWIHFDDSSVYRIKQQQVLEEQAYMLFYEKCDEETKT